MSYWSWSARLTHCRTRHLCRGEKKGQQGAPRGSLGLEEGSRRSRGCLASAGVWCVAYPLPTSVFLRVNEAQTAAVETLSPIHLSLVTRKPLSVALLGAQSSVIGDLRTKASVQWLCPLSPDPGPSGHLYVNGEGERGIRRPPTPELSLEIHTSSLLTFPEQEVARWPLEGKGYEHVIHP